MNYQPVSVEEAAKDWFKDRAFVTAYVALEAEFGLASALIMAGGQAKPGASRISRKRKRKLPESTASRGKDL